MTRYDRAAAVLVVLVGPNLAEHISEALAGYRRELDRARRQPPTGLDELFAAIGRSTARSRQFALHPIPGGDNGAGNQDGYLLAVGEASDVAGVSTRTLQRLIAGGQVPVVRVGRRVYVDPVALLDALDLEGPRCAIRSAS